MLGRLRVLPAERARSSSHDTIQRDGGIQAGSLALASHDKGIRRVRDIRALFVH